MSERFLDSRRDREALDHWITREDDHLEANYEDKQSSWSDDLPDLDDKYDREDYDNLCTWEDGDEDDSQG